MSSGWECPKCGEVWAPHVAKCENCRAGSGKVAPPVAAPVAPPAAVPTVGELWDQWIPVVSKTPSWGTKRSHARNLARVSFVVDGGGETTMFDLPWPEATPHAANLYRAVRTTESNRRLGRDGRTGLVNDSTVNRELCSLQAMLTYHRDIRKTISHNPLDGFTRTDETGNARLTSLTPEEVAAFLEPAHPLFADICMVAYRAVGMRNTEARLLKKSEIDWTAGTITLPSVRNKNRQARVIPFPADCESILRRHCEISRGPYVFVKPNDPKRLQPVSMFFMQYHLQRTRKLTGMTGVDDETLVVHHLRGSAVTTLVEQGAPGEFVRKAAGMSTRTFARYTKWTRAQQEVLRGFQNRSVTPPTPITAELQADRRPPSGTTRHGLKSVKSAGEDQ